MTAWPAVLAAGALSVALRLLPLILLSTGPPPAWLRRVGALIAPVVFASLASAAVAAAMVSRGVGGAAPEALAAATALAIGRISGRRWLSVSAGLVVLVGLTVTPGA
ncbi:MAG: AzlD domain-containing protein [bacterium]